MIEGPHADDRQIQIKKVLQPHEILRELADGVGAVGAQRSVIAERLQQVELAADIRLVGATRIGSQLRHVRLRREMKYNVRPGPFDKNASLFRLAQISFDDIHPADHTCPIGGTEDRAPDIPIGFRLNRFG